MRAAGPTSDPGIATDRLAKDYGGRRGVFDLDLRVERGEAFGCIGPTAPGRRRRSGC